MLLLNLNFAMIYIIHKMLVLLKNHLNYLKNSIFKCFHKCKMQTDNNEVYTLKNKT